MGGETKLTNSDLHVAVSRHMLRHSFLADHLEAGKQFSPEMIAKMCDAYRQSMQYAERNPENTYARGLAYKVLTRTIAVANAALEKNLLSPEGRKNLVSAFVSLDDDQMAEIWDRATPYAHNMMIEIREFLFEAEKRESVESAIRPVPHAQL